MMNAKRKRAGPLALFLALALVLSCCLTVPVLAADGDAASKTAATTQVEDDDDGGGGFFFSLDELGDFFKRIFIDTINNFFASIVNSAFALVDQLMLDILDVSFYAEHMVNIGNTTIFSTSALRSVYNFMYLLACSLVTLKFLFKGFRIYILWRGGDADASPRDMLVGVAEAAVVMVSFPYLYGKFVDVVLWIAESVMGRLGIMRLAGANGVLGGVIDMVAAPGELLVTLILDLVFFIFTVVLWLRLVSNGIELLILRLGLPLATLGLIDSDAALFKNYVQVFIKNSLTVVIQVCLMSAAFRVIGTFRFLNVLFAIALMLTAMRTPRLLSQFLVSQGGGGGGLTQKAYSAAMLARTAKLLLAA